MGVRPQKPVDVLRAMAAPREVVEWVRKLPQAEAVRIAWIDVPRAEWLPYIAVLRGFDHDAIVKTTCSLALERAGTPSEPTLVRLTDALRAGTDHGRTALADVEASFEDLRLAMIAHGSAAPLPWMFWAKLVLELARACRRGNPLIGVTLALRALVHTGGRRANTDLIARFRDRLTLGG